MQKNLSELAIETFYVNPPQINFSAGEVTFPFAFDDQYTFAEKINFGLDVPKQHHDAFTHACHLLAIALGISYYKAFIPPHISINYPVAQNTPVFFKNLYEQGLGEFAYRNQVKITNHITFDHDDVLTDTPQAKLEQKNAVLIGGGKDSNVSIEIAKTFDTPTILLAVNPAKPMIDCAEASGLELITITRTLDPLLFELNEKGALNGHIPITAVISFITVAAAFIYDFDTIILSNERSANEGNLVEGDQSVNHQYSKSFDFEQDFQAFITENFETNLDYFSLLRPLSELQIAANFAKMDTYDTHFTSCNKAFKINKEKGVGWCGECPKCLFVFLMLATAMPLNRLTQIFGKNLFSHEALLDGFKELIGLSDNKPWECVGEFKESAAAFRILAQKEDYKDLWIVTKMNEAIPMSEEEFNQSLAKYLTPSTQHAIPHKYKEKLDAYLEQ